MTKKELSEYYGLKPKQEIKLEDVFNDEKRQGVKDLINEHKQDDENGKPITYWGGLAEPKQETLEEASWKYNPLKKLDGEFLRHAFKEGAKWQQERMYSEAIEFAEWIRIKDFQTTSKNNWIGLDIKYYTTQELFEQFKNK
jgi:hypothetical protein